MERCLAAAMAADAVGYPCQQYFRLWEGALAESLSRNILWALVGLAFPVLPTGAAADGPNGSLRSSTKWIPGRSNQADFQAVIRLLDGAISYDCHTILGGPILARFARMRGRYEERIF